LKQDPWASFQGVNVNVPETPSQRSQTSDWQQQRVQSGVPLATSPPGFEAVGPAQQQFSSTGVSGGVSFGGCGWLGATPFVGGGLSSVQASFGGTSFQTQQQQHLGKGQQFGEGKGNQGVEGLSPGFGTKGTFGPVGGFPGKGQQAFQNTGGSVSSLPSDTATLQSMVMQLLGRIQSMEQSFQTSGVSSGGLGNSTVGFGGAPGISVQGFPGLANQMNGFGRSDGGQFSRDKSSLDLFSKTDMKLPACPIPKTEQWKDREGEIMGFHDFVSNHRGWAALASSDFACEINDSCRAVSEIHVSMLTREQQVRSSRLQAILKSCFSSHPRTDTLIRAFQEGIGVTGLTAGQFSDNGYELLRVLTAEYSLRTRSEALTLRSEMMNKG